ncbi:uncharacterized protein ACDP82_006097 [Pangshura tecta]
MSLTVAVLLLTQLSSLWGLGTDELPVQLPATSEAVLGGTALLSCTYPPEADLILYWTRLGSASERNVYTYYRGEHLALHDDPAYRGRATVPAGQPGRGDGALRLHNVTLADEGRYRCRVKSNRGMGVAETELRLIAPALLPLPAERDTDLPRRGGLPPRHRHHPRQHWQGLRGRDPGCQGAPGAIQRRPRGRRALLPPASYTCIVNTPLLQQNRSGTLGWEEPQPAWKGWAGVGLAVVVLGSGALWAGQQRRKGQRHQGSRPPQEAEPAREGDPLGGAGPTCMRRGDPPDTLQEPPPPSQHLCPSPRPSHA